MEAVRGCRRVEEACERELEGAGGREKGDERAAAGAGAARSGGQLRRRVGDEWVAVNGEQEREGEEDDTDPLRKRASVARQLALLLHALARDLKGLRRGAAGSGGPKAGGKVD